MVRARSREEKVPPVAITMYSSSSKKEGNVGQKEGREGVGQGEGR